MKTELGMVGSGRKGHRGTLWALRIGLLVLPVAMVIYPGNLRSADDSPTLEDARNASSIDLARAYFSSLVLIRQILPLVESGAAVNIPEGAISKENLPQYQARFEARAAIYQSAINERSIANIGGPFRLKSATKACNKVRSDWLSFIQSDEFMYIEARQEGNEATLLTHMKPDNGERAFEQAAVIVEYALVTAEFLNSSFVWTGEVRPGELKLRPAVDVLDSWPQWAAPPKKKDLQNCEVVLSTVEAD